MDSKGEESKISYPNIFFMIDSFEEVSDSRQRSLRPRPLAERRRRVGRARSRRVWTPTNMAPTLPGVG